MKTTAKLFSILTLLALVLAFTPLRAVHAAGVLYVKPAPSGTGNCSSWANACTLQTALTNATSGNEIWVAAGTHMPGIDRTATFTLKNGVAIYGGFNGTETLRSQRAPATNVTILSGEIGVAGISDNSYHVVTGGGTNLTAVLDGFTVTAGNADGGGYPDYTDRGGGMYNNSSNPTLTNVTFSANLATYGGGMYNRNSNPTLMNVTFNVNSADFGGGMNNLLGTPYLTNVTFNDNSADFGGGMYNSSSDLYLTNVTFSNNSATTYGGGMDNGGSDPTLLNVTFSGNSAPDGGGMYNGNSSPTLTNVTFNANIATDQGGGMYNNILTSNRPTLTNVTFSGNSAASGGGMYNGTPSTLTNVTFSDNTAAVSGGGMYNASSWPSLSNVTFNGNSAPSGGGMYNASSGPTLTNATFSTNSAAISGGGMYNSSSSPVITDSIFWGNSTEFFNATITPVINDSIVAGGCPSSTCTNVINADPLLGTLADNGGLTQTMALGAGSPAINAGNNATCAVTDQRGITRPQGSACDMGAFEVDYPPTVNSIIRADASPTSAASVKFTITFSEPMTGVDAANFSLTTTGVSDATVSGVSGLGSIYTITVNTGAGNGTIRLDVPVSATITDMAGNPLASLPYIIGDAYTVTRVYSLFLPLILR